MICAIIFTYFNYKVDKFYNYFSKFSFNKFCYITSENCVINKSSFENVITHGGYDFLIFTSKIDTSNFKSKYKQVELNDASFLDKILSDLNIRICFTEHILDNEVIYGFSPFFCEYVLLDNFKINFQFVIKSNSLIVGCPMVFSGY